MLTYRPTDYNRNRELARHDFSHLRSLQCGIQKFEYEFKTELEATEKFRRFLAQESPALSSNFTL